MEEQYLMHYGVLGMRWGIRKAPERTGSQGRSGKSSGGNSKSKSSSSTRQATSQATGLKAKYESLSPETQKKIKIAGLTVAAAGIIYATHKGKIDGSVKQFFKNINEKKITKNTYYVMKNKNDILRSAKATLKYKKYLTDADLATAAKMTSTMGALHSNRQREIRRGADYVMAALAIGTAANAVYGMSKSPVGQKANQEAQKINQKIKNKKK